MEDEENRGPNDKRAYEDQFTAFFSFSLELFLIFSLSLSYSWTLIVFLEHSWRSVAYLRFRARKQRKSTKSQEDIQITNYKWFCLQVSNCLYDFLAIFGMHGTSVWFLGYELSLEWRIPWIDNGFSQPFHFMDSHGVVGFIFVFWLVLMFLWIWVELLVPGALVG